MKHSITTGPQTLTAPGAFTGVLDTSALPAQATLFLTVLAITPGATARVAIEDYTNLSTGTEQAPLTPDNLPAALWQFGGPGALSGPAAANIPDAPLKVSRPGHELPDIRMGSANTHLRAVLVSLTGPSGASITVHAEADC